MMDTFQLLLQALTALQHEAWGVHERVRPVCCTAACVKAAAGCEIERNLAGRNKALHGWVIIDLHLKVTVTPELVELHRTQYIFTPQSKACRMWDAGWMLCTEPAAFDALRVSLRQSLTPAQTEKTHILAAWHTVADPLGHNVG